jgi:hypothetical protein
MVRHVRQEGAGSISKLKIRRAKLQQQTRRDVVSSQDNRPHNRRSPRRENQSPPKIAKQINAQISEVRDFLVEIWGNSPKNWLVANIID